VADFPNRGKAYWQEVGGKADDILGSIVPRYTTPFPKLRIRSAWWRSQEYACVVLHESARRRVRNLGQYAVSQRVLMCDSPVIRPSMEDPWVSRELSFDAERRRLKVHTIPFNPLSQSPLEDRLAQSRAFAQEDAAGLSRPTDDDFDLLLDQLRLGYIEQVLSIG
jgi:hypothetical protein